MRTGHITQTGVTGHRLNQTGVRRCHHAPFSNAVIFGFLGPHNGHNKKSMILALWASKLEKISGQQAQVTVPECGPGQIDRCAAGCAPKGVKFCEFSVVGQKFRACGALLGRLRRKPESKWLRGETFLFWARRRRRKFCPKGP